MNGIYERTKEPSITAFVDWTVDFVSKLNPTTTIIYGLVAIVFFVIYSRMLKNFLKGFMLIGIVGTLAFFSYYIAVFQPAYPKDQVVNALNSQEAKDFLAHRDIKEIEIRGLIVRDVDTATITREQVAIIGEVDLTKLKEITFTIKDDEGSQFFTVFGYVEEAKEKRKRDYVTYYQLDESQLKDELLADDFFNMPMFNVTVYKKLKE